MRRVPVAELLDSDSGTPQEVAESLDDLRWFNRYFGGSHTTSALLRQVAVKTGLKSFEYLDVAAASADGAMRARSELMENGVRMNVTLLDRSPRHFPAATDRPRVAAVAGDALQLPFADRSFDVVGSSLFLHHLEQAEVGPYFRESLRVSRVAVIVNDLVRSRFHWLTALAGRPLYRSRLTRHDAPASVRRAYVREELEPILHNLGASRIEWSKHYFCRMGLILWRHSS